jgi:hypothetical protein
MEAIWVATEMRAGGAYAHSVLAIEEWKKQQRRVLERRQIFFMI